MNPRRLLPPLAIMLLLTLLLTGWVAVRGGTDPGAESEQAADASASSAATEARTVLAEWDSARSSAWARADVGALRRLYVPGAHAGGADESMLREYAVRGLAVRGLTTQVLAIKVLDSSAEVLRLRVTDRVAAGEIVDSDGNVVSDLPTDQASTRVVTLRRADDSGDDASWLVQNVRDVVDPSRG